MWVRGLRAHERRRWQFRLTAPPWSRRCTSVFYYCETRRWGRSPCFTPYLQVPQLDKPPTCWGLETDRRTRPSIFTVAPNDWRHQVFVSQDLQVCGKLTLSDTSDEDRRTERNPSSCLDYTLTHAHLHEHSRQTDTANIHTGDII